MPPKIPYRARIGAVHHTDPWCPIGRQIPPDLLVEDAGGLPLCSTCRVRGQARPPSGAFTREVESDDGATDPEPSHPERSQGAMT
jgi:hypothetical protein